MIWKLMDKWNISIQITHIQASRISIKHPSLAVMILLSVLLRLSQWHNYTLCSDCPWGPGTNTSLALRNKSLAGKQQHCQVGCLFCVVWAKKLWTLDSNVSVRAYHIIRWQCFSFILKIYFYLFAFLFKQTMRWSTGNVMLNHFSYRVFKLDLWEGVWYNSMTEVIPLSIWALNGPLKYSLVKGNFRKQYFLNFFF